LIVFVGLTKVFCETSTCKARSLVSRLLQQFKWAFPGANRRQVPAGREFSRVYVIFGCWSVQSPAKTFSNGYLQAQGTTAFRSVRVLFERLNVEAYFDEASSGRVFSSLFCRL